LEDLPRQLAADRAAGSGHQHRLALDGPGDASRVERDDPAVEQVRRLDLPRIDARHRVQHLVEVGHDADAGPLLDADERVRDGAHDPAAAVADRDDQLIDRHAPEERRQRRNPADDGRAVHAHPPLRAVVVEKGRDAVVDRLVEPHALVHALAQVSDADDDGRAPPAAARHPDAPVAPGDAHEGVQPGHAEQREDRPQQEHRVRKPGRGRDADRGLDQGRAEGGLQDVDRVAEARVIPQAAEVIGGQEIGEHRGRSGREHAGEIVRVELEIETQEKSQSIGGEDRQDVDRQHDESAAGESARRCHGADHTGRRAAGPWSPCITFIRSSGSVRKPSPSRNGKGAQARVY
jgi:hypothetical protein